MKIEPITFEPINRLQLIKYAGASGDFNPIHTIDEEAQQAGLPGVIAHGMLTMALMAKLFSPYMRIGMIKNYDTRFTNKVFIGDRLVVRAEWDKSDEESGEIINHYLVYAENQKNEVVAKGKVDFLLYS